MAFLIATKKHRTAPQPVTGYYLDNARGRVSIVVPQAATNLITNPSIETGMTGYSAVGGATIAQSSTEQRRGVYSLKITPGAGLNDGAYFGTVTLTVRTFYSFSLDVRGAAGVEYQIYFANTLGQRQSRLTKFKATGLWQRVALPYQVLFGGLHRLYLTKVNSTSTTPFYTDGWKCQSGEDSTYFDGDSVGYVRGQVAYYWTGTPHASTSVRSGQTRSGGTVMNLKDLGFRLLTIMGLGMGTLHDVATPTPLVGGAFYQDTVIDPRQFSLVGAIHGKSEIELLQKRAALINLVRPDVATPNQPLLMLYENVDECGDVIGDPVEIVCTYQNGLTGQTDNFYQERLAMTFTVYLPMLTLQGNDGQALSYQQSVSNANYIIQRDAAGVWSALGTGLNATFNRHSMGIGPDGALYAGGQFTTAGGTTVNRVAKWSPTTQTWSALGTGMNDQVRAIAFGPDGAVYVAGDFTTAGGVAANRIARWDGSTWSALGILGLNGIAHAMVFGADGALYVVGAFTTAGGVAANRIAKWDGSTWSAVGSGLSGTGVDIAKGTDGNLYVCGVFATAGGVTVNSIAKYTLSTATWSALGSGISGGGATAYALDFAPDGTLYLTGDFTTVGGVTASNIAKWNGTTWTPLGSGLSNSGFEVYVARDGNVYVGGVFTSAGGISVPTPNAVWNGFSWAQIEAVLPGATNIFSIVDSPDGTLYFGSATSGTAITAVATTVANTATKQTWPKFIFTGPGTLYKIGNYTTKKFIYFNITLSTGEQAVLDLTPGNVSFVSTFRGNILGTILPGSDLTTFALLPGDNSISVFIGGSVTVATGATIQWKNTVWSVEGALP